MLATAAAIVLALRAGGPPAPSRLRVEYADSPRGIDAVVPRFSWVPPCVDGSASAAEAGVITGQSRAAGGDECREQKQASYQIVVRRGSTAGPVIWDSGLASSPSTNVHYGGTALEPDADFSWTVRSTVASTAGKTRGSAASSSFSTGLQSRADWKDAAWVGAPPVWSPYTAPHSRSPEHAQRPQHSSGTSCFDNLAGTYRGSMK